MMSEWDSALVHYVCHLLAVIFDKKEEGLRTLGRSLNDTWKLLRGGLGRVGAVIRCACIHISNAGEPLR